MEATSGNPHDAGKFAGGLIAALGQLAANDDQERRRDSAKHATDSLAPPPPAPSPTPSSPLLPHDSSPLFFESSLLESSLLSQDSTSQFHMFSSPTLCSIPTMSLSPHHNNYQFSTSSSSSLQSSSYFHDPQLASQEPPFSPELLSCSIAPSPPPYAACQVEALRTSAPLSPLFLSPPPYSSSTSPIPSPSFSGCPYPEPPRRPNSAPPPHSCSSWPDPQPSNDCEFQQASTPWYIESPPRGVDLRESWLLSSSSGPRSPILQKYQLVSNPFRPSCIISVPSIKVKTPKKVRFLERSLSKESVGGSIARRKLDASVKGGCRLRNDALEELSLSSLSLVKRKPTLRKSKLTFLGEKYCSKWSDEISREISKTATDKSPHSAQKSNNTTISSNTKLFTSANEQKVECSLNMSPWKNVNSISEKPSKPSENCTPANKSLFGYTDDSSLENFSKLASINSGIISKQLSPFSEPSTTKRSSNTDPVTNPFTSLSAGIMSSNCSAKGAALLSQYGTKYRGDPKSRRVLYKLRERRRKVGGLPDGELPNLTGLTIGENCTAACEDGTGAAAQCCCGTEDDDLPKRTLSLSGSDPSAAAGRGAVFRSTGGSLVASSEGRQQPCECRGGNCRPASAFHARSHRRTTARNVRSCSEEARKEQFEDTTLEELAAYIDNYLYFPKKMSFLAEMMYT